VEGVTTVTPHPSDGAIDEEEPSGAQSAPSTNLPDSQSGIAIRRRELRRLIIGSAVAIMVVVLAVALLISTNGTGAESSATVGTGTTAPDFTLPNLLSTGTEPLPAVNLYDLGKKNRHAVVLNFYASWCPPCRAETPLLASAAKSEAAGGSLVQFVGVDVADSPSGGLAFTRQAGITYPVGADRNFEVASLFGLSTEPHTYFIDDHGVVIGQVSGQLSASTLYSWLHRLHAAG
jgi:cytochrome c biogenesis protein CcmG/thiol:disulfide interchange protein DsbE